MKTLLGTMSSGVGAKIHLSDRRHTGLGPDAKRHGRLLLYFVLEASANSVADQM